VIHEDLVILTAWMVENGYEASDIAYAVEKPHKYADELAQAKAALEAEAAVEASESQGVIWDDPESPAAKKAIEEIRATTAAMRAGRVEDLPAGARPVLRLVKS
jgi:hypothetical protein